MAAVRSRGGVAVVAPDVLELAREGDHRAFATLVRAYDRGLRALAFRLLGDRERMDDALQEGYVRAFRALPGFRGATRNACRQLTNAMTITTSNGVIAPPQRAPIHRTACASVRSRFGSHALKAFVRFGKQPASPAPNRNRTTAIEM